MVKLDVQRWELGAQRLYQGLPETIPVNTLTDIRELKNTKFCIFCDVFQTFLLFMQFSFNFMRGGALGTIEVEPK